MVASAFMMLCTPLEGQPEPFHLTPRIETWLGGGLSSEVDSVCSASSIGAAMAKVDKKNGRTAENFMIGACLVVTNVFNERK